MRWQKESQRQLTWRIGWLSESRVLCSPGWPQIYSGAIRGFGFLSPLLLLLWDPGHAPPYTRAQMWPLPLSGSPFLNLLFRVSWANCYPSPIRKKGRVVNWFSSLIRPTSCQGYSDILDRTCPSHRKHCNPLTKDSPASELRPHLTSHRD